MSAVASHVLPMFGGLLVGAIVGLLGAGGSVITVPMLVLLYGLPLQTAATTSLGVVFAAAFVAGWGHWRAGNVRVRTAGALGALAALGSIAGTLALEMASKDGYLLGFAALLVAGSAAMWSPPRHSGAGAIECILEASWRECSKLAALGISVGFLTGFFGVGGGFLVVPALVLLQGFPLREAIGTSVWVVTLAALAGFLGHLGDNDVALGEVLPFLVGGVAGALLGQRLAATLDVGLLRKAFSIGLFALAGLLVARSLAWS